MFKIGTTSYIYPADILVNVKKLAGRVRDIELVLFEFEEASNFPDKAVIDELVDVSDRYGISYTIHLPLDLALAGEKPDIEKAIRVIGLTRRLNPEGYIVHLDGGGQRDVSARLETSVDSLKALAGAVDSCSLLCVENLESQSQEFTDSVLDAMPVSTCADVGHLWKRGEDPAPVLAKRLDRTRIVHLHGLQGRDHRSLSFAEPIDLDPVVEFLLLNYQGILTLEVFSEIDFNESLEALRASAARVLQRYPVRSGF